MKQNQHKQNIKRTKQTLASLTLSKLLWGVFGTNRSTQLLESFSELKIVILEQNWVTTRNPSLIHENMLGKGRCESRANLYGFGMEFASLTREGNQTLAEPL